MEKTQQPLCEHEDESYILERTELEDRGTVVLENNLEQIQQLWISIFVILKTRENKTLICLTYFKSIIV